MHARGLHLIKTPAFALAFLLLLVTLVEISSLAGPFQFDDYHVIVDNPAVHSLAAWWQSLPGIRPLLKLSYALNWVLTPTAFGFHVFNLGLHLLNTALLWVWLQRVLPGSSALRLRAASIAALLWALHPAQTEAVTYICGRSVSLMATFWLAALLSASVERARPAYMSAVWVLLALAVRETAWIIPFSLLLVARVQGFTLRESLRRLWPPFALVLAAALVFVIEPHYRRLLDVGFAQRGLGTQLLSQINALHYFLRGPVLGLVPNLDPDIPLQTAVDGPWLLQAACFATALGVSALALWRRQAWWAAGVLWFVLALLPTNSIFPRVDLASDRHLYPALIGPAWALGLWLASRRRGLWLVAALVLLFSVATLIRNEDYRSELALWVRTVQQSPQKARPWSNLGYACEQAGDRACATYAYERALTINPADSKTRLNLYFLNKERGKK